MIRLVRDRLDELEGVLGKDQDGWWYPHEDRVAKEPEFRKGIVGDSGGKLRPVRRDGFCWISL